MIGQILAVLFLVIPFFLVLGTLVIKRLLYVGGPNEVLIFSGSRPKAIRGGYHIRIPLLQVVDRMDLSNMAVEVSVSNAYSKGGIPLHVQGVANLKIAGEQPMLGYAMQRFLGKSRKEIIAVAKETLEGNLRGVLSQLTPEEVNNDKLAFAEKLVEEAEHDLGRLGLTLDVLKIQNVSDDVGYLDSIGRKQTAALLRRAREAEAEAHAEAVIRDAEQRRRARLSELEADIQIARAETEKRIADAQTRREALIAEQVGQVKAAIARAEAELKVQQARIEQVRRKLAADVLEPANAQMEADRNAAKGKAAKVIEDGKATALVLEEMIKTWQAGGSNARDIFLMQKLQAVLDSLVSTIQDVHIDKMTVLPGGSSRATRAVQLVEELKAGIGVDLPKVIEQIAGGRATPALSDRGAPQAATGSPGARAERATQGERRAARPLIDTGRPAALDSDSAPAGAPGTAAVRAAAQQTGQRTTANTGRIPLPRPEPLTVSREIPRPGEAAPPAATPDSPARQIAAPPPAELDASTRAVMERLERVKAARDRMKAPKTGETVEPSPLDLWLSEQDQDS